MLLLLLLFIRIVIVTTLGLSAPVPRGRKGKKVKAQSTHPVVQDADWLAGCNPDALFQEDSYKKHLKHHCNKYVAKGCVTLTAEL